MEMIALSAALGAGVGGISAANRGDDPLTGALLGGATGAAGGALGGALAPASSVGSTAAGSAAQAFPVAMEAAIPAVSLDAVAGAAPNLMLPATAEWAAPFMVQDSIMPGLQAMDENLAMGNIAQTAGVQPPTVENPLTAMLKGNKTKEMFSMARNVSGMGDQRRQEMASVRPPSIKQGSAPQLATPVVSLLQEQQPMRKRRISLI